MDEIVYYPDTTTKVGPIRNIEGLALLSSRIVNDQCTYSAEFPEFDVLGVKVSNKFDYNAVTEELKNSFGDDVLCHPNRLGWFIFNWRSHFNRRMT